MKNGNNRPPGRGPALIEHDEAKSKKKKGGALVPTALLEKSLTKDLAEQAKALAKVEPVGAAASIIRTKNRRFTIGEQAVEAPIQCVVLATGAMQAYYDTEYDPNTKSSPVCFALAPTEAELTPDPTSPDKQHDGPCVTCPQNMPGSGRRGGFSRACGLRRRLALLMIDDQSEDPQFASIELSVTAIKGWSNYVRSLAGIYSIPYFLAVTELDFEDDKSGDFWHLTMRFVDKLIKIRPDWLQPAKGVKPGSDGWFDTTFIGRKVREINEGRLLLAPPLTGAPEPTGKGKRRVPVGKVKSKPKAKPASNRRQGGFQAAPQRAAGGRGRG